MSPSWHPSRCVLLSAWPQKPLKSRDKHAACSASSPSSHSVPCSQSLHPEQTWRHAFLHHVGEFFVGPGQFQGLPDPEELKLFFKLATLMLRSVASSPDLCSSIHAPKSGRQRSASCNCSVARPQRHVLPPSYHWDWRHEFQSTWDHQLPLQFLHDSAALFRGSDAASSESLFVERLVVSLLAFWEECRIRLPVKTYSLFQPELHVCLTRWCPNLALQVVLHGHSFMGQPTHMLNCQLPLPSNAACKGGPTRFRFFQNQCSTLVGRKSSGLPS